MTDQTDTALSNPGFDDRAVSWRPFAGFDGLYYHLLHVDHQAGVVDMLMKFDPNMRCVPHRHVGPTKTLVLAGRHSLYDPSGGDPAPRISRGPGGFGANPGDEAHIEGGGPDGAVILLMMTAVDGKVYEILDQDGAVTRVITLDDFQRGLDKQARQAA